VTHPAEILDMSRSQRLLLIFINATAAASSFVGSWLVADRIDWFPFPILIIFAGIAGCGYFTSRAESIRRSMREPGSR
jgi:uncharacterized membrane protein YedE/YeeE